MENKFKVHPCFNSCPVTEAENVGEEDSSGGWGHTFHWISESNLEHLLNGGVIRIEDGEYEHYLKLKEF